MFNVLDKLQKEEKIRYYGVSVETVEESRKSKCSSFKVIFNIFRQNQLNSCCRWQKKELV